MDVNMMLRNGNLGGFKMINWIEEHTGVIVVLFCCIFTIEIGIGAWRLPKEFRTSIIPKTEKVFDFNVRANERIYALEMRTDLLIDIERQRVLTEKQPIEE